MDEIILDRIGAAAVIRLNRPQALNSITLDMVRSIAGALEQYASATDVACVVLTGEGSRGLCAGGDVRRIHDQGRAGDPDAAQFWREEFPLNRRLGSYEKPLVALMDGIVMGGGVGLSAHGRYRVVTERTRLAMPETSIGYFPDVGMTWLLPRAPGETGAWLGLTGSEIGAADAIHAGLADVCISSSRLPEFVQALGTVPPENAYVAVDALMSEFSTVPAAGILAANRDLIDRTFGFDDIDAIIWALQTDGSSFARDTLAVLHKRSPTSLKLTLKLLRLGRESADLGACLEREFAAACEVLHGHDFYEGVRAALIDKDRNPRWNPATLAEVTDADILRYLQPAKDPLFRSGPEPQVDLSLSSSGMTVQR
ncbi:enoyl-CoA hydratase/isomerase family protein [Pararhizobium sp.]|uniref:enoyl-CoA hydratase/isomerase family protein n=1 Tax=Pararhizobium sp. TaxID=1977563 RepID=UPI00271DDA5B|nr:enoyl-CoA hydratase/isomerase family protein [Pararhizobium sp.]MDO9417818.1 enoyl-CoA hydratase/isomerase family protein [Pararhizobium sp.]